MPPSPPPRWLLSLCQPTEHIGSDTGDRVTEVIKDCAPSPHRGLESWLWSVRHLLPGRLPCCEKARASLEGRPMERPVDVETEMLASPVLRPPCGLPRGPAWPKLPTRRT